MIDVIEASAEHIPDLAGAMIERDRLAFAGIGLEPKSAVQIALEASSKAWTGRVDGVPVCMFGVTSHGDAAKPWLISAVGLEAHRRAFLRLNRVYIKKMVAEFPAMSDIVDADNAVSIRWLWWLGFRLGDPVEIDGKLFIPFETVG